MLVLAMISYYEYKPELIRERERKSQKQDCSQKICEILCDNILKYVTHRLENNAIACSCDMDGRDVILHFDSVHFEICEE
jgi:hypothetical protein